MSNQKVLVIDDLEDLVYVTSQYVELWGFEAVPQLVTQNTTLADVARILEQGDICWVITDFNMPMFDGLMVIDLALELGVPANRIVLCSAAESETLKHDVESRGAAFVPKPVKFQALRQVLQSAA